MNKCMNECYHTYRTLLPFIRLTPSPFSRIMMTKQETPARPTNIKVQIQPKAEKNKHKTMKKMKEIQQMKKKKEKKNHISVAAPQQGDRTPLQTRIRNNENPNPNPNQQAHQPFLLCHDIIMPNPHITHIITIIKHQHLPQLIRPSSMV